MNSHFQRFLSNIGTSKDAIFTIIPAVTFTIIEASFNIVPVIEPDGVGFMAGAIGLVLGKIHTIFQESRFVITNNARKFITFVKKWSTYSDDVNLQTLVRDLENEVAFTKQGVMSASELSRSLEGSKKFFRDMVSKEIVKSKPNPQGV